MGDHQAYGLQRRTRSRTSSASLHYHIIYEDVDLLRSTVQQDGCDLETKNDIGDTALISGWAPIWAHYIAQQLII